MKSDEAHWNCIFRDTADMQLGWYEDNPARTLQLLNLIPQWQCSVAFLPGAGTSVLIDTLLDAGVKLVLNDISDEALQRVKLRVGAKADAIDWVCQDIARPLEEDSASIDIWIDRAVLHFLNEETDIQGYFRNLHRKVKVGGYALFAEFPLHGAAQCAGLKLHRYSINELSNRLGTAFKLLKQFECTYMNPAGNPRPYIYALYQREEEPSLPERFSSPSLPGKRSR